MICVFFLVRCKTCLTKKFPFGISVVKHPSTFSRKGWQKDHHIWGTTEDKNLLKFVAEKNKKFQGMLKRDSDLTSDGLVEITFDNKDGTMRKGFEVCHLYAHILPCCCSHDPRRN